MNKDGDIFKLIPKIMEEVGYIAKDQKNLIQKYNFRGVDDIYANVQKILAKYGVFTVPNVIEERTEDRSTKSGSALIYRVLKIEFTFYASDGSNFKATVIGEGMDSGDKASNKAMSVAHKYAFLQVLCIPTQEAKDPEHDSHDISVIYTGDAKQKIALAKICKDLHEINDPKVMKEISDYLVTNKIAFSALENSVMNYISERTL